MGTTIKATCPTCGEVSLESTDIILRITQKTSGTYAFICPQCRRSVTKPADDRIIRLLMSAGVEPLADGIPAEVLERHDGPPLTVDDLLDLHEALNRDDVFDRIEGKP